MCGITLLEISKKRKEITKTVSSEEITNVATSKVAILRIEECI